MRQSVASVQQIRAMRAFGLVVGMPLDALAGLLFRQQWPPAACRLPRSAPRPRPAPLAPLARGSCQPTPSGVPADGSLSAGRRRPAQVGWSLGSSTLLSPLGTCTVYKLRSAPLKQLLVGSCESCEGSNCSCQQRAVDVIRAHAHTGPSPMFLSFGSFGSLSPSPSCGCPPAGSCLCGLCLLASRSYAPAPAAPAACAWPADLSKTQVGAHHSALILSHDFPAAESGGREGQRARVLCHKALERACAVKGLSHSPCFLVPLVQTQLSSQARIRKKVF